MNGAIIYSTKHGSTGQYARWIGEATGLPVLSISDPGANPANFDFLILGSPVFYYKLHLRQWLKANAETIRQRPTILFTVSGAGSGAKLDGWLSDSMQNSLLTHMDHVALRGRWGPEDLTIWERIGLFIGALKNRDPQARKDELQGFDYMDKSSIEPIVEKVRQLRAMTTGAQL